MKQLQELTYQNQLKETSAQLWILEQEFSHLLQQEVRINEQDENQLNLILRDAERRIEAAKRGLSLAGKIKDPAERKEHQRKMLGHLNRTRTLLDRVVKEFFPEKVPNDPDGLETPPVRDEFLSPKQAMDALGINASKFQQLVGSNKLKMQNDNGRWAVRGTDVQKLLDNPGASPAKRNFGDALKNTLFGRKLSQDFN